jgi:membrane-bound lytic murein transglycosylase A
MRLAEITPLLTDSLSEESFFSALENNISTLEKNTSLPEVLSFGPYAITKSKYILSLREILKYRNGDWINYIKNNFSFLEVYGKDKWGEAFSTGYYEPHVIGSLKKTEKFSRGIFRLPYDFKKNEKYLSREQIDSSTVLEDMAIDIAWVDPVDAFFIQIQGSGVIDLVTGGRLKIGYAGQNGHSYVPIGKFLTDHIPLKEMSMQKIKKYLKSISREEEQAILNKNPSYVFFKVIEDSAITYGGMNVTNGRTIATDKEFFPKGALGFLDIREPIFENIDDETPKELKRSPRFIFDQDTGGAIKGGGRLDLYFGSGDYYAQKAGGFKELAKLYYLLPNDYLAMYFLHE